MAVSCVGRMVSEVGVATRGAVAQWLVPGAETLVLVFVEGMSVLVGTLEAVAGSKLGAGGAV